MGNAVTRTQHTSLSVCCVRRVALPVMPVMLGNAGKVRGSGRGVRRFSPEFLSQRHLIFGPSAQVLCRVGTDVKIGDMSTHPAFTRYNAPPVEILLWLAQEQQNGRLYSRRGLMRMTKQERAYRKAPLYSRAGITMALDHFERTGTIEYFGHIYRRIAVVGQPLPPGAASILNSGPGIAPRE